MGAGILNVLGDCVDNKFSVLRYTIYLDLARILDELGYNDRMILRNICRLFQEFHERWFVVGDSHRRAGQHV